MAQQGAVGLVFYILRTQGFGGTPARSAHAVVCMSAVAVLMVWPWLTLHVRPVPWSADGAVSRSPFWRGASAREGEDGSHIAAFAGEKLIRRLREKYVGANAFRPQACTSLPINFEAMVIRIR